jgi:hypothetical protein
MMIALRSCQKVRSPACEALVLGNLFPHPFGETRRGRLAVTINLLAGPPSAAHGAI